MAKIKTLIILISMLFSLNCFSQEIENVRISQEGTNIVVVYDLVGKPGRYDVKLFYTIDDGKIWRGPLSNVTGDVIAQIPGLNKKANWNAASLNKPIESFIQFKLYAEVSNLKEEVIEKTNYPAEYYKYKKSKNIWLGSAMVCSGIGVFSYLQSEAYYEQYQTATTGAADLHQKVKLYDQITPAAFGVAGLCALEFILKAGKQSKAKKQKLSFYPQPIKNGAGIGLAYTF